MNRGKVSIKTFFTGLGLTLLLFITFQINANNNRCKQFFKSLTQLTDTIPAQDSSIPNHAKINSATDTSINKKDTAKIKLTTDTSIHKKDTSVKIITVDTLLVSKDSLSSPIDYSAADSGILMIPSKQFFLYGNANTKNKDIELNAATIHYNQQTQTVTAYGGTDTANNPLSKPKITQQGSTSISDTINFNLKSQKGLSKNTYYNEGEIFVNAQTVKKVTKDIAFAYRARFTTCNLDTPHFDIRARKLELINNKFAVSGPAFPEFEGVPIPIPIPFGIYPLERGRHSGLLPPSFTSNDGYGLGLENLGYYQVLSDYWDVTTRANLYSYGGWTLDINPKYYKRYKYQGNLDLSIQKSKILNQGFVSKEEFTESSIFQINWSHSMNTKARPGTSFSASVNAGSTKFNQLVPNNADQNYRNQQSSSITYAKTWDQGKYNLSLAANHDQNNIDHLINIRLPTVNFNAATIYPFQKKEQIGQPKWYEKLGISYTGTLLNQFSFYDTTAFRFKHLLDTAQWGVDHNIPISLSLPPIGPLLISPSVSYAERWFGQKNIFSWNENSKKVDTSIQRGFYAAREMSFGLSFNTRIFGTFNFPKSKNITAIRHEIKPFVSLNFKPDFVSKYYQTVQIDSTKNNFYRVPELSGLFTTFSEGRFGGVNFGIDNLLEMKVKNKKDTSNGGLKKVRLIDGLSISSGYNFFPDSSNALKLSPFSLNLHSTLFDKINITGSAILDPYKTDTLGRDINQFLIKDGKLARFTNGMLAISTSLKSKSKDKRTDQERLPEDETLTPDEQQRELDYVRQNPADFVDFNIPWTLQLSFSLNYYKAITTNFQTTTQVTTNINLNGDFSLTPKWKIGGSTYFDFRSGTIQTISMFITREMHCWQMAINLQIGQFKSFSITLNPKSGILRDLKINRSRYFTNF
ncbi:MAG: putative LPS assembly protein LptD [Chitinophagaceae bacterium]